MASGDPIFGGLNRLQDITKNLDERGLVLSLAAFAEEALEDLLLAFMQPGDAAKSLLTGFNAPLGTLSARTKAAFALNLITLNQYENLERLRRIRNEFAHCWEPISFNEPRVASHIKELHFSPLVDEFPKSRFEKVRRTVAALLTEIRSNTNLLKESGNGAPSRGSHLVPGLPEGTPNRLSVCERELAQIAQELLEITDAERRGFLLSQQTRWLSLIQIYKDATEADEGEDGLGITALYLQED